MLRELGDPAALARLDRFHCNDVLARIEPFAPGGWVRGGSRFFTRPWPISPEHPLPVAVGRSQVVEMNLHDDLSAAVSGGLNPSVDLCVQVQNLVGPDESDLDKLTVTLNGTTVASRADASGFWVVCRPDPTLFVDGPNRIELALPPECPATLIVHDVQAWVRYGS